MPAMFRLFAENLLPVLLAAGTGYLAAWRWQIDPRPIEPQVFYWGRSADGRPRAELGPPPCAALADAM